MFINAYAKRVSVIYAEHYDRKTRSHIADPGTPFPQEVGRGHPGCAPSPENSDDDHGRTGTHQPRDAHQGREGPTPASVWASIATVLFVLGMTEGLSELADPKHDTIGLGLEDELLPQRIRSPHKFKGSG